ncbi:MAG: TetR/AcrR family transcriptional regulator C-terminal domain-containing protein [Actinomycetota bacterium]
MPKTEEIPENAKRTAGEGEASAGHRREPLTRERIVRTALRLMDEEGLDAVTMRHIGRELGVEAMSLYNHVRDKEDILDGVAEAVMADYRPEPASEDWVGWARAAAHEWRRLLKAHPNVITLLVERKHPMTSVEALQPMEHALEIIRQGGLPEEDTVQAFRAIGGYIFGFVMMEVGNMVAGQGERYTDAQMEELARALPADRLPRFLELLPYLARCDDDATFDFGLELLLDGIRARAARARRAAGS